MNKTASCFPFWRWTISFAIVVAVAVLVVHYTAVPIVADDKGASTPTPNATTVKAPMPAEQSPPAPRAAAETEKPIKVIQETGGKPTEPKSEAGPMLGKKPVDETKGVAEPPKKDAESTAPGTTEEPTEAEEPEEPEAAEEDKDAEEEQEVEPEALENQSCLDCHNPDILEMSVEDRLDNVEVEGEPQPPRKKPRYSLEKFSLSIEEEKYAAGTHADTMCVECHTDIEALPHKQRLEAVDCASCHEESVELIKASAHGEKAGSKGLTCTGCHDVHYSKGMDAYAKDFKAKACMDCHAAYGLDTIKAHAGLYEYRIHVKMGCLICHEGEKPLVHQIPYVKTKVATCESCHSRHTILTSEKPKPMSFFAYITQTTFINSDVIKKFGYVVGANRIPALDTILILVVLGPLGLPAVHGGLRILTRRKEPIELPEEKILLHPLPERIWHWLQALCIVVLILSGIVLHWPETLPGWFDTMVTVHNWFGWGAVIAFLFWLVYNLASGRITHYLPKKGEIPTGIIKQAKFYGYGIFKHEPHPYAPSEDNKFNPLQKIAYLKFQVFLFPILLISGLLYMYPETFSGVIGTIGGIKVLGLIHYILGALFAAFLMAHLYLATTGETVGENFKAIITGYGIKSEHDEHHTA